MRDKLRKWEVPRRSIEQEKIIGEGHFGQVWKADVWQLHKTKGSTITAVKSLKGAIYSFSNLWR